MDTVIIPFRPNKPDIDPLLQKHLDALGFVTVAGYKRWCYKHGFSTNLRKTSAQLRSECRLAERLKAADKHPVSRYHSPGLAKNFTRIYKGEITEEERTHSFSFYCEAFDHLKSDPKAQNALYRLLIRVEKYANLFNGRHFHLRSLVALARHHKDWIRPLEEWYPEGRNLREQFLHFLWHLLVRYDVPRFMNQVWRRIDWHNEETRHHQQWFIDLTSGKNIRNVKHLPLHLTKRMAHLFSQAPQNRSLFHAFRWAQIMAMDGSEDLVRAIYRTRLGKSFENEAFWVTVIQFFVNNSLLHTDHVGPIVDYIYNQKYVFQEVIQPGGGVVEGPPPHPSFSMKGRSADKLLCKVEDWHGELNAGDYVAFEKWNSSEIRPLQHTETDDTGQTRTWTIHELCTSWELALEGKAMHHCVRSYAGKCVSGECSVWSLQVQTGPEEPISVMTIAVNNAERRITQARGKYNLLPHRKAGRRRDISGSYLVLLKEAPRLMGMWTEQTGLQNG